MPLTRIQTGSVRRKLLFVFLVFSIALILAYIISNMAFREMMVRVDKMTSPDVKIHLVNQVTREIMHLDNRQRNDVANVYSSFNDYTEEYTTIVQLLDSLNVIYSKDERQRQRLDSVKQILQKRDSLFSAYMAAKRSVINNPKLERELNSLGQLLSEPPSENLVTTTERQKISTTVSAADEEPKSGDKGLLSWIFGSKRKESQEKRIVTEETNVRVDTIQAKTPDSTIALIDKAVQRIQADQLQQRAQYIGREVALSEASNNLIGNILDVMQEVEKDALRQTEIEHQEARQVVNQSINQISLIFIVFLLVISIMIYFILADIRKNNAYRMALEAAKEVAEYHAAAKQRFLSNMSHELRTPLQSIVGYAEQLEQNNSEDKPMIQAIHQSSEHLLYIVNEILDYSRVNSGKIILNEHSFDMVETVRNIVSTIQPLAHQKNLILQHKTNLQSQHYFIGDAFRIKQIMFNLLSNSIKFTDVGFVRLEVNAKPSKNTEKVDLEINVIDTGIGIDPSDHERIFDHFEQAGHTSYSIQHGSGLGLSIVKAIIDSMGGEITLESEHGKGSRFTVNIPILKSAPIRKRKLSTPRESIEIDFKGKVWIVDDDALIRNLCERILTKNNIDHQSFGDPFECLETPLDEDVHTILMDIRMPGMNGFTLNKELRNRYPDRSLRIIAFTAQALSDEQSEILSRGFDDILLKPFREKNLLSTLGIESNTSIEIAGFELDQKSDDILQLFERDTLEDMERLRSFYQDRDTENMSLLFHRLAGRISQFGNEKLGMKLRRLEIDTRNDEVPDIVPLKNIFQEIQQYVRQVRDEQFLVK